MSSPMQVPQINLVYAQALDRLLKGSSSVVRVPVDELARGRGKPELGRKEDLIAFAGAFEPALAILGHDASRPIE